MDRGPGREAHHRIGAVLLAPPGIVGNVLTFLDDSGDPGFKIDKGSTASRGRSLSAAACPSRSLLGALDDTETFATQFVIRS